MAKNWNSLTYNMIIDRHNNKCTLKHPLYNDNVKLMLEYRNNGDYWNMVHLYDLFKLNSMFGFRHGKIPLFKMSLWNFVSASHHENKQSLSQRLGYIVVFNIRDKVSCCGLRDFIHSSRQWSCCWTVRSVECGEKARMFLQRKWGWEHFLRFLWYAALWGTDVWVRCWRQQGVEAFQWRDLARRHSPILPSSTNSMLMGYWQLK